MHIPEEIPIGIILLMSTTFMIFLKILEGYGKSLSENDKLVKELKRVSDKLKSEIPSIEEIKRLEVLKDKREKVKYQREIENHQRRISDIIRTKATTQKFTVDYNISDKIFSEIKDIFKEKEWELRYNFAKRKLAISPINEPIKPKSYR